MDIRHLPLMLVAGLISAGCSDKSAPEKKRANESEISHSPTLDAQDENESQPREDEIAGDCVVFLRATNVVPAKTLTGDCPTCPAEAEPREVLIFQQFQMDRISCSATSCEVAVTIRATFNPGTGGEMTGGLAAWISPEQRAAYLQGRVPDGQQVFRVKIIYKWTGKGWRAVEFDKADPQ